LPPNSERHHCIREPGAEREIIDDGEEFMQTFTEVISSLLMPHISLQALRRIYNDR